MGKYVDDRSEEQKRTHTILITATDSFMSGWGEATNGFSKCAWACRPDQDWKKVYDWVKSRSDMKHVKVRFKPWNPVIGFMLTQHVHIYVVDDNHPALTS